MLKSTRNTLKPEINMGYTALTEQDIQEMLRDIGVASIDDLFKDIPETLILKESLSIPEDLSEIELDRCMKEIEKMNAPYPHFLGAGAYNHYIPPVVNHLTQRSEFYTAYTPYQPEVSQGTLTAIFEFQTFMCMLTGMDVANASMYDGATATAEAVLMSLRSNNRKRALVSSALHPHYRDVLKTYAWASGFEILETSLLEGTSDPGHIAKAMDKTVGCIVAQNPNFLGCIEDLAGIAEIAHKHDAHLIVVVTEPLSMALLKSPGFSGADIVCGEGQSFGNPVGFGGPMLGFLAAKEQFMRKMPGRLVGETTDLRGEKAYVLTLQTREQHIRRERATSNICSNQGLCLLRATIYLAYYGNKLRDLALLNHRRASYLKEKLLGKGFECFITKPFFNEFVLRFSNAAALYSRLCENGIIPGVLLGDYYPEFGDCFLFCVTESNTTQDIDHFIEVLEHIV